MTRKDYQLIAEILRKTDLPGNLRDILALNFAQALKRDNPRFKAVRFCQATRPDIAESKAIKELNAKGFIGPAQGSRQRLERVVRDPILDLSLRENA